MCQKKSSLKITSQLNKNSNNVHLTDKIQFPFAWLWAMVSYVPLVTLLVNPPIWDAHLLLVLSVWVFLLTLPAMLCRKQWLYRASVVLLFVEGFVNLAHWLVLKCPISASSLFVFFNTNAQEATEFMSLKQSPRWLLLIPYIVLFVVAMKRVPIFSLRSKWMKMIVGALTVACLLFLTEAAVNKRFLRMAVPPYAKAVVSFAQESSSYKLLQKRELKEVTATASEESQVTILILGESCNRNHMSLYGYARNTSPELSKRKDILVFDNVVSPYSYTMASVLHLLSESNMDEERPIEQCVLLQEVLASAGFKTFWISNQSPIGVWDNAVASIANLSDVVRYVNLGGNSSFESTQIASYDDLLLAPLQKVLEDDNAPKKWIVLHLMGSHSQYDKRYPSNFNVFKEGKDKRQRTIDAYDNSVLYSDYIVNAMLDILDAYAKKHPQTRVSALYISDHGENVYDDGQNAGHDVADTIPYSIAEIPFVLWTNPYNARDLQRADSLRKLLHQPYMIDDLFHTFIDLSNVSSPIFQPARSMFNAQYNVERVRRLSDGRTYVGKK